MGMAGVIPGVSGGTVAFIVGIYPRLLKSLRSLDRYALKLLFKGKLKELGKKLDFSFLATLGLGVIASFLSLSHLLGWAFKANPLYVWAIFFGLVGASLVSIIRSIDRWSYSICLALILGVIVAIFISFLTPQKENTHFLYLLICGAVAICSMIIPGISGSFVLVLMGNYQLIVIKSINHLTSGNWEIAGKILLPVLVGAVLGMLSFIRLLNWLFTHYFAWAMSLISGFIMGSLLVIWPWKESATHMIFEKEGVPVTVKYTYHLPDLTQTNDWIALSLILVGAGLVVAISQKPKKPENF